MKHIVAWKLKEQAKTEALIADINAMSTMSMVQEIKGVRLAQSSTHDVALISTFATQEDLDAYQVDSQHIAFKEKYQDVLCDRVCLDME